MRAIINVQELRPSNNLFEAEAPTKKQMIKPILNVVD